MPFFYLFEGEERRMNLFRKKEMQIVTPISGECLPLENVADPVFSGKLMGEGIAIKPISDRVVAPCDIEITLISDTGHALGLKTDDGLEIMIHIGIDTVRRKGKGFQVLVKQGDRVKVGKPLVHFEREEMEIEGIDTSVMVVFLNGTDFAINDIKKTGGVIEGKDNIASLSKKRKVIE